MNAAGPSYLEDHLGYWLRMVSNAVSRSFARKIEAEGVTVAEWAFLRVLLDHDGIAPTALAERMGMTRGAISKLADRLAEKALVARGARPGDRRAQVLTLTPAARTLTPRLAALADENDAEYFSALTGEERRQLEQLLRKMAAGRDLTVVPVD